MQFYLSTDTKPVIEDTVEWDIVYKIFVYQVAGGYVFTYRGGPSGHEFYGKHREGGDGMDGLPFSTKEEALAAAKDERVEVDEVVVTDAIMRKSADKRDIEVFPWMSGFAFSPYGKSGVCLKKGEDTTGIYGGIPFATIEEAVEAAANPAAYVVVNF